MRPAQILLVSLVLAGCEVPTKPSPLGDEDVVTIKGSAFDADGVALANQAITLEKESPEQRDRDNGSASVTLTTDAAGTFSTTTKGYLTKNARGEAHVYRLVAGARPGPVAKRRFQPTQKAVDLAPLRLWRGPTEFNKQQAYMGFDWPAPPGPAATYDVKVERGGKLAWSVAAPQAAMSLNYGLFTPNQAHDMVVEAHQGDTELVSAVTPSTPPDDALAKVYKPASIKDATGVDRPGLFDGELLLPAFVGNGTGGELQPKELIIDLGEAKRLSQVVAYGVVQPPLAIHYSDTPGAWGPEKGRVRTAFGTADLPNPTVRYLRVVGPGDAPFLLHMNELRVIGP